MKIKRIIGTSLLCALISTNFSSPKLHASEQSSVSTVAVISKYAINETESAGYIYSMVTENQSILPDEVKQFKVYAGEDLKLRTSTKDDSDVITIVPKGSEVTVTFSGDKWSDIIFEDQVGIVATDYLKEEKVVSSEENKETEEKDKADTKKEEKEKEIPNNTIVSEEDAKKNSEAPAKEVESTDNELTEVYEEISLYTTENLNVRSSESTSSSVITVLKKGTYITGFDHGDWVEVDINGKTGYVMKKYLSTEKPKVEAPKKETPVAPSSDSNSVEEMVQTALNQVGKPYVFASANPAVGFDCSGLTFYSLRSVGYKIGRTAADQYNYGTFVPRNEIQRGDLLFFSSGWGIDHVGIYLGNGQMVHASTYDTGVIISNINSGGYYSNAYVGAKRILK